MHIEIQRYIIVLAVYVDRLWIDFIVRTTDSFSTIAQIGEPNQLAFVMGHK